MNLIEVLENQKIVNEFKMKRSRGNNRVKIRTLNESRSAEMTPRLLTKIMMQNDNIKELPLLERTPNHKNLGVFMSVLPIQGIHEVTKVKEKQNVATEGSEKQLTESNKRKHSKLQLSRLSPETVKKYFMSKQMTHQKELKSRERKLVLEAENNVYKLIEKEYRYMLRENRPKIGVLKASKLQPIERVHTISTPNAKRSFVSLKKSILPPSPFIAMKKPLEKQRLVDRMRICSFFYLLNPPKDPCEKVTYLVLKGNNQRLVEKTLRKRSTFESSRITTQVSILWSQLRDKKFKVKMVVDDFDVKAKIPKLDKFLSFNLFKVEKRLVEELYRRLSVMTLFPHLDLSSTSLTNHLKGVYCISRKHLLGDLAAAYNHENGAPLIPIPETYTVSKEDYFNDLNSVLKQIEGSGADCLWILKPGEFSNRGKGIQLAKYSEITIKCEKLCKRKKGNAIVIQRYLINPLLYEGRKFDLRCYCLIVNLPYVTNVFWYTEGYARTSSALYDENCNDDMDVHLTNEAVQVKNKKEFGKFEPGNKLYYHHLTAYFKSKRIDFDETRLKLKVNLELIPRK